MCRWHRLLGDDVFFLTGTDEHGLKIQRAAEAQGLTPEGDGRPHERALQGGVAAARHLLRRLHPHHRAPPLTGPCSSCSRRCTTTATSSSAPTRASTASSCEAYYTEADLVDGNCPIHGTPVEQVKEENYFFKLSRYQQPLLDWYEAHPDFVQPEGKRNEALGLIRGGLQDFSISRTSITWGVPIPWDESHVTYVWYDALINYATAVGLRHRPRALRRLVAGGPPHHRQGHPALPLRVLAGHAAGRRASSRRVASHVHGFLLVGGEKMSKTKLNQIAPADLVADFGVDGFRYHFLRDQQFGPDGDFSYERMVDRYNADLANNLGNLLSRVATVVAEQVRRRRSRAVARQPARGGRGRGRTRPRPRHGTRVAPSDALEATWRLIRETNAYLEANEPWKAEPGAAVDAVMGDALEALRIVADPRVARGAHGGRGGVAAHRPRRFAGRPTPARRGDVGPVPRAGSAVEKGAPLFPRIKPPLMPLLVVVSRPQDGVIFH